MNVPRRIAIAVLSMAATAGLAAPFVPVRAHAAQDQSSPTGTKWGELAKTVSQPPVNARVDRVWKAIPGLKGWRLDVEKSKEATKQANDDRLHLKFQSVSPKVSLSSLPAHPIYRGPKQEKSVCLMFNVSWGEAHVPGLLKTLSAQHVKATFFLDGKWAQEHPDLTRAIADAGQCIGSHGSGHPDFKRLSMERLRSQIKGSNEAIAAISGKHPYVLAPPAGSYDERTVQTAAANGMYTILWTVDTLDWRRPPASVIVHRVISQVEPGALVLMHPTEPTEQALGPLIAKLKDHGYSFKTVDQMVDEIPAVKPPDTLSAKS